MVKIVDLHLKDVEKRLVENGLKGNLSKQSRRWLAQNRCSPDFGARPLA